MGSEDVAPDGAWWAGVLPLQRCRAYGAEIGQLRPQDHADLSHSTFFKPPALPEVADLKFLTRRNTVAAPIVATE